MPSDVNADDSFEFYLLINKVCTQFEFSVDFYIYLYCRLKYKHTPPHTFFCPITNFWLTFDHSFPQNSLFKWVVYVGQNQLLKIDHKCSTGLRLRLWALGRPFKKLKLA